MKSFKVTQNGSRTHSLNQFELESFIIQTFQVFPLNTLLVQQKKFFF